MEILLAPLSQVIQTAIRVKVYKAWNKRHNKKSSSPMFHIGGKNVLRPQERKLIGIRHSKIRFFLRGQNLTLKKLRNKMHENTRKVT